LRRHTLRVAENLLDSLVRKSEQDNRGSVGLFCAHVSAWNDSWRPSACHLALYVCKKCARLSCSLLSGCHAVSGMHYTLRHHQATRRARARGRGPPLTPLDFRDRWCRWKRDCCAYRNHLVHH